jgi:glyoxylase-like metal-dependent hydrolase (beta-lactamase superfamily II)
MDFRVISLGALAAHPLWNERAPARTGHATTTLVRSKDAVVLVDPGLPAPAVAARLSERAGLRPSDITHVFLTSFHPDCRRGIEAFDRAEWLISQAEREAVGVPIAQGLARLAETARSLADAGEEVPEDQAAMVEVLQRDVALLQRCRPAPDSLAPGVDLFPLPGVTPGLTGLLLAEPRRTVLIAGDAIPTIEHLEQGKVLPDCHDRELAQESFKEAIEIADVLVLGRDNWVIGPGRG